MDVRECSHSEAFVLEACQSCPEQFRVIVVLLLVLPARTNVRCFDLPLHGLQGDYIFCW